MMSSTSTKFRISYMLATLLLFTFSNTMRFMGVIDIIRFEVTIFISMTVFMFIIVFVCSFLDVLHDGGSNVTTTMCVLRISLFVSMVMITSFRFSRGFFLIFEMSVWTFYFLCMTMMNSMWLLFAYVMFQLMLYSHFKFLFRFIKIFKINSLSICECSFHILFSSFQSMTTLPCTFENICLLGNRSTNVVGDEAP